MIHGVWDYVFHSVSLESAEPQSKFFLQKTKARRIPLQEAKLSTK